MRPRASFSAGEARRIALAAQGFGRLSGVRPDAAALTRLVRKLGALQIDSVNILARSHYLPAFSRLGPYPTTALDRAAYGGRRRTLFEYWGHEASLLPVEAWPLLQWRMQDAASGERTWGNLYRISREQPALIERVLAEVADQGPLAASQLSHTVKGKGGWWGWSDTKQAIEYLFWCGRVTVADRRNFERRYDLPARVLPRDVLASEPLPKELAQHRLVMIAAAALGVATETDLRDYFRLPPRDCRSSIAALVEAGELLPVAVRGWAAPAYLHPAARLPRRMEGGALLSPFDSLIWNRERTQRVFGFHYRLAFYTPGANRTHGYYVMPFLLGDRLVARVDLKADRAAAALRVLGAFGEAEPADDRIAVPLAAHLARLAEWLGMAVVTVESRGSLAEALRRIHSPPPGEAPGPTEV